MDDDVKPSLSLSFRDILIKQSDILELDTSVLDTRVLFVWETVNNAMCSEDTTVVAFGEELDQHFKAFLRRLDIYLSWYATEVKKKGKLRLSIDNEDNDCFRIVFANDRCNRVVNFILDPDRYRISSSFKRAHDTVEFASTGHVKGLFTKD